MSTSPGPWLGADGPSWVIVLGSLHVRVGEPLQDHLVHRFYSGGSEGYCRGFWGKSKRTRGMSNRQVFALTQLVPREFM
jgi:hypothetical protein